MTCFMALMFLVTAAGVAGGAAAGCCSPGAAALGSWTKGHLAALRQPWGREKKAQILGPSPLCALSVYFLPLAAMTMGRGWVGMGLGVRR